jgi:hypothetical protein
MKKLLLTSLLFCLIASSINAKTIVLTEEMKENDLDSPKFQLFISKSGKQIGTAKVVFDGDYDDYEKFLKVDNDKKNKQILNDTTGHVINNLNASSYISGDMMNNILENAGVGIVVSFIGNAIAADDHYVQVTDYTNNGKFVGRMIKYVASKESLDEEDLAMIYQSTSSDSYGYSEGIVRIYKRNKEIAMDYYHKELENKK